MPLSRKLPPRAKPVTFYYNKTMDETVSTLFAQLIPFLLIAAIGFAVNMAKRIRIMRKTENFIPLTGTVVAYKSEMEKKAEFQFRNSNLRRRTYVSPDVLWRDTRNGYLVQYYPIVRFVLEDREYEVTVSPALNAKPQLNAPMEILVNAENLKEAYSAVEKEKTSLLVSLVSWGLVLYVLFRVMLWVVRHYSGAPADF